MIKVESKYFGEFGCFEHLKLSVVELEDRLKLEVSARYKGKDYVSSLHPWTIAMINSCYTKFHQMSYLRILCAKSIEAKIKLNSKNC